MIDITIDSAAVEKQLSQFPEIIDKAAYNTAQFGLVTLVKATPVRTGAARASWTIVKTNQGYKVQSSIGRGATYMPYLESGTGLFGPKHEMIVPKKARALKIDIGGGKFIYRTKSKGMAAKKIIANNLKKITDQFDIELNKVLTTIMGR